MVEITTWFRLGTVGMAAGTLGLGYGFRLVPEQNRRRYSLLVVVPLIALVAYALMALGIGSIQTQSGKTTYALRYLDWLLTTPIHILYLGLLAGVARRKILEALVLMAATISFGFVGAFLAFPLGWIGFLAGSLAFVGVIRYVYTVFATAVTGQDQTTVAVFRKLRAFTVVLWLIYPLIWLLAPAGFDLMNLKTATLVIAYLDVVSKVGFGLIALSGQLSVSKNQTGSATPAD